MRRLHSLFSLLLRLFVAGIFVPLGVFKAVMYPEYVAAFAGWGLPVPEFTVAVVAVVEFVAGAAVLVGFFGRVSAAALAVVTMGAFVTAGPDALSIAAFALSGAVAANGVGEYHVVTERDALATLNERLRRPNSE